MGIWGWIRCTNPASKPPSASPAPLSRFVLLPAIYTLLVLLVRMAERPLYLGGRAMGVGGLGVKTLKD